jgi:putative redox protein
LTAGKEYIMVEAKLTLTTRGGSGRQFLGESGSGHRVVMDDADGDTGAKPIELALLALGGCTAFDVVGILRKMRQNVTGYEIELVAEQRDELPKVFTHIEIKHILHGDITPQSVEKAIHLSESKYCSVGAMISKTAEIATTYEIISETTPASVVS